MTFENAGGVAHGTLALRQALTVSSDVFFYQLGQRANPTGDDSALIQTWGRRLGLGRRTGIDLPNELPGLMPTPEWRNKLFDKKLTDRPWSVGDNINLSVGQGDLKANPLQMAVAYAAVANGGKVVRPHLGLRIEDASGRVLQELEPPTPRKLHDRRRPTGRRSSTACAAPPASRAAPRPRSSRASTIPIAGKTGTAEKGLGRADQSWYVALAPYPIPSTWWRSPTRPAASAPTPPRRWRAQILATLLNVENDEGGEPGGVSD